MTHQISKRTRRGYFPKNPISNKTILKTLKADSTLEITGRCYPVSVYISNHQKQ